MAEIVRLIEDRGVIRPVEILERSLRGWQPEQLLGRHCLSLGKLGIEPVFGRYIRSCRRSCPHQAVIDQSLARA